MVARARPEQLSLASDGMADVGRDQNLIAAFAGVQILAPRQASLLEARVDDDLVLAAGGLERLQLAVRHAEAPRPPCSRGAVGNEVGLVRQSEDVPLQLGERHRLPDGAL